VTATEKHFTVQEIADLWQMSAMTVRRLFQDEPGVLKLGVVRTMRSARPHVMLRIPASVLDRFHQQRSSGFGPEIKRRRRAV
jgi:transcriptional regulator GlxA family with amidase domain